MGLVFLTIGNSCLDFPGDVRVVRETVPVVKDLADSLSWTMLDLPVPASFAANATAAADADGADLVRAQNGFVASGFWMCALLTLVAAVHAPVVAGARSRVRRAVREDKARAAAAADPGADADAAEDVEPQDRAPTIADKIVASAPKLELFICLLSYQALATGASALLFRPAASPRGAALRAVAGAVFAVGPVGFLALVTYFVLTRTRGAGARSVFVTVDLPSAPGGTGKTCFDRCASAKTRAQPRKRTRSRWVDKAPPDDTKAIGLLRALSDGHGHRYREEDGRFWNGYTENWGVLWKYFTPSRACGGAPVGIVVLLLFRCLLGVAIGALGGRDKASQRTQTTAMVVLFACVAVYILCGRPFIRAQANFGEGLIHAALAAVCTLNYWIIDDEVLGLKLSKETVGWIMFGVIAGALLLRMANCLRVVVPEWWRLRGHVFELLLCRRPSTEAQVSGVSFL